VFTKKTAKKGLHTKSGETHFTIGQLKRTNGLKVRKNGTGRRQKGPAKKIGIRRRVPIGEKTRQRDVL